jgi:DNA-binding response OmpR family regulator
VNAAVATMTSAGNGPHRVDTEVLRAQDTELDLGARLLRVGGRCMPLPAKEFELLFVLLAHAGQVVHRELLLAAGWTNPREVGKALEVYIRRLREKIETDPHHPTHIRTVRGIGYIFDREALGWAS